MKILRNLSIIMTILFVLGGCDNTETYELSFETHGGEPIESVSADGGSTIELPEPEREYHSFEGWYLDEDYNDPAEFDTVPEESLTLHARWDFDESEYVSALNEVEGLLGFEVILSKRHEDTLEEVSELSHFSDILSAQRPYENHDAFLTDMEDALEVSMAMDLAMDHYHNADAFDTDTLFTSVGETIDATTLESVFDEEASSIVQTLNMYGTTLGDFNQEAMGDYFKDLDGETYAGLMSISENFLDGNQAVKDKDELLEALSSMEEGHTLHLASGTYSLEETLVLSLEGTELMAATAEATVLDGGGVETLLSIEEGANDVALEGLTFRNFTNHGVLSLGANTRISRATVNAPSLLESSVLAFEGEGAQVLNTQFEAPISATEASAFITLETSDVLLEDNRFMGGHVVPSGIRVDASDATLETITIENNEFMNFMSQSLVFETDEANALVNVSVSSNSMSGGELGILLHGESGLDDVSVESNTFESMDTYIHYEGDEDVSWDALLEANTFDFEPYPMGGAAYPVLPIELALEMSDDTLTVTEGVVSGVEAEAFYLEDNTGALRVTSSDTVSEGERVLVGGALLKDSYSTSLHEVLAQETLSSDMALPESQYMDASELDNDAFLRRFVHHRLRLEGLEILSRSGDLLTLALEDSESQIELVVGEGLELADYAAGDHVSIEGVRLIHENGDYTLSLEDAAHLSLYETPEYTIDTNLEVGETEFVLKDSMVPLELILESAAESPATTKGQFEMVVNGPDGGSVTLSDQVFPLTMVDAMHYEDEALFDLPGEGTMERSLNMMFTHPGLYTIEISLYDEDEKLIGETVHAFEVETPYITVDFENLADEYLLDDAEVPLYLETKDGVPYVDIETFLSLLDGGSQDGAIDLDALNIVETDAGIDIVYDWEDEETGESGSEAFQFDFDDNTVTVDSFDVFTAAQQGTQTDFGADLELADYDLQEGDPVVFEFEDYNFELLNYEEDYLMPFHIANLFFSGSMFDVYYNGDALYGIDTYQVLDGDVTDTLQDSDWNSESMPETYQEATYDYLAFSFDHFYGLKEDQDVNTYYNVFPDDIAQSGGRSHYREIFNSVYALDDLHSWYSITGAYASSYNPSASISDLGPRSQAFYEADDLLRQNRVCAQQGPSYYDDGRVARVPIHEFDENTPDAFKAMLDRVAEKGTVEEVIVDLSCNTGGVVGGMIQVLGYMTDEPIPLYDINPTDGSKSTYYYEADIEKYDFEWHVFSSPKTFSAGNMMVQVVKDMGLGTIIGQDSAGGAASIKANITPSGAILFMSSTSVSANADFESTEMGIPVDVQIPFDLYMDEATVLDAIE